MPNEPLILAIDQGTTNTKVIDRWTSTTVAEMALQAAIQADAYIQAGGTTEMDEKQSIDMVLLTPDNACDYYQFAPVDAGSSLNCQ